MNLLAFDTSTDTLFIAIQRGDQLWQHQAAGGANSSATLIPPSSRAPGSGSELVDLKAIVFGRGPGSSPGCAPPARLPRVWPWARSCLLPIDTLLAVAEEARDQHGCTDVMAVLDARMSEVYHAGYRWADGLWQATTRAGRVRPRSLDRCPPAVRGGQCPSRLSRRVWPLRPSTWRPCPRPPRCCAWHRALMADGHLIDSLLRPAAVHPR